MVHALGPDQFEALLGRLAPDRDAAGREYEQLRQRLITIFTYRRCPHPEDLADETMDRVARKLLEMGPAFEGSDPSRFVFGVAWNVAKESFHGRREVQMSSTLDPAAAPDTDDEIEANGERCLDQCLRRLADPERRLVLHYFEEEKRAKIARRSALARDLGISSNALRLRIHRVVQQLRDCVVNCLEASKPRPLGLGQPATNGRTPCG
jgi:DNA-directed RNA polymerase specialized sigma24 family protein